MLKMLRYFNKLIVLKNLTKLFVQIFEIEQIKILICIFIYKHEKETIN